jgi:hypothetical protein
MLKLKMDEDETEFLQNEEIEEYDDSENFVQDSNIFAGQDNDNFVLQDSDNFALESESSQLPSSIVEMVKPVPKLALKKL